jgi:hypothetical protein
MVASARREALSLGRDSEFCANKIREVVMSSIEVVGYRQMEIGGPSPGPGAKQMEGPKTSVARFEWALWGAGDVLIARGPIFVFGEKVQLAGWAAGREYWYVTELGTQVAAVRFSVECQELVPASLAAPMLSQYSAGDAFVAPMVPPSAPLVPGDAVLSCPSVHGVPRTSALGTKLATDAAVNLELDGSRIRRLNWYWSGAQPLSLFPGGAQVGERVDLTLISNGSQGFPQVGWFKCEQAA